MFKEKIIIRISFNEYRTFIVLNNKFGNLFEIACSDDEILLSTASIDDINIISKITANNTKIGN